MTTPIYTDCDVKKMYNHIEHVIIVLGLSLIIIIGASTTFFFIKLEQETVSNRIAALLLERQQILDSIQLTPGIKSHYKSLLYVKPQNHRDYLNSIYNY